MGADIKKLRIRIKSVNSTLHLTKAMGLVASSKLKKSNSAMLRSREYSDAVMSTVKMLCRVNECMQSPYMQDNGADKTKIIVIAGDRGLAGGYNANVFRLSKEFENAEFIPVGKRACDRFSGEQILCEGFGFAEARELSERLCREFENKEFSKLLILYTKYNSVLSQEATAKTLLPLEKDESAPASGAVFEPDELTVLNSIVSEYLAGIIYSLVCESYACEIAARRNAMDSAGKNAQQMIDDLRLKYNRARQGAITQEITEIVAGSGE